MCCMHSLSQNNFINVNVHCYLQANNITFLFQAAVPFAVIGSNTIIEVRSRKVRGRMYPWGVVEVENPEHCDFIKLRTMLM